jgi:hypothetical protein
MTTTTKATTLSAKADAALFKMQFTSLMAMIGSLLADTDEAEEAFKQAQVTLGELITEAKT